MTLIIFFIFSGALTSFLFFSPGRANRFRPIGPWIMIEPHNTLPGRFRVDLRHMNLNDPPSMRTLSNLSGVPGWIGVKGTPIKNEDGSITLNAPYHVVFYETSMARQYTLLYPELDTPEEAAELYDKVAIMYYASRNIDTNYPINAEGRKSAAIEREPYYKNVIICAVEILNMERSMPDAAVKACSATQDDWDAWE